MKFSIIMRVYAPQGVNRQTVRNRNAVSAKPLMILAVESYRWFRERMTFATFTRFKRLDTFLAQYHDRPCNAWVQ